MYTHISINEKWRGALGTGSGSTAKLARSDSFTDRSPPRQVSLPHRSASPASQHPSQVCLPDRSAFHTIQPLRRVTLPDRTASKWAPR